VIACGRSSDGGALADGLGIVDGVVDLRALTSNTSGITAATVDGIHYTDAVYDAVAVLVATASQARVQDAAQ
jgi:hypothetical protein